MDERCITGLESLPEALRGGVLTIGNLDGVHLGHQRILAVAKELAGAEGAAVVALTFDPPPDLVLRPGDAPQRLTPATVKCELLRQAGCDYVVTARSDPALLGLSPQEFIDAVIVGRFAPRHIVEGGNFLFGRGRAGDVELLRRAGAAAGFAVHVAAPVEIDLPNGRRIVSSTLIRNLVAGGRVEDAASCLGRPFTLHGPIIRGRGVGGGLGWPTANLDPHEQVWPGDGVYAGWAEVAGRQYASAISVGTKPTFAADGGARTVEAYLLDASGDFYGLPMALSFIRRLRDQRRYDSPEALAAQMARDVEEVRKP